MDPFIDAITATTAKLEPTTDQIHALNHFAKRYGRSWRGRLRQFWATGADAREPNGYLLRQVLNEFGPLLLVKFKPVTPDAHCRLVVDPKIT